MPATDSPAASSLRVLSVVRGSCVLLLLSLALMGIVGATAGPSAVDPAVDPAAGAGAAQGDHPVIRLQRAVATSAAPPATTRAVTPATTRAVTPVTTRAVTPVASPVTTPAAPPPRPEAVIPAPTAADSSVPGCPVPDPSGSGGCVTPALGLLLAQVVQAFGDLPVSCWDRRDGDPHSDHPLGRACDYTIGAIGTYPPPADVERGWMLASWLQVNAEPLHVSYVIWQGYIWSRAYPAEGWRTYTGGGYYSTSGPTNGHHDHVHVSTVD